MKKLTKITAAALQPVALALDQSGQLLIVSGHGNVYALPPGADEFSLAVLVPETTADRPGVTAWLPVSRWRDAHNWLEVSTRAEPWHFISPDGSAFIPAH